MKKKDLTIIDDLLNRTNNLPEILHLRAAEIGYILTDEDKKLLLETYEKLDDILKESAAFINVKFPGRQSFIYAWNNIDFDTKIGGIKVITTDREHTKREWKKGIFDLKSLLKTLRNEIILMIDDEPYSDNPDKETKNNNFSANNIIYNEGNVTGKQVQSSLLDNHKAVKTPPIAAIAMIKNILIGLFVTIVGGIIIWYLTTKTFI
ncbi:MAG: hypothetical protein GZ091_15270 [Paludibacter sp.]|nr:hypothetical protein [Paludibacter sp.]